MISNPLILRPQGVLALWTSSWRKGWKALRMDFPAAWGQAASTSGISKPSVGALSALQAPATNMGLQRQKGLEGKVFGPAPTAVYVRSVYTLKELPQPQVVLTLGLSNLKPAPSSDSM